MQSKGYVYFPGLFLTVHRELISPAISVAKDASPNCRHRFENCCELLVVFSDFNDGSGVRQDFLLDLLKFEAGLWRGFIYAS